MTATNRFPRASFPSLFAVGAALVVLVGLVSAVGAGERQTVAPPPTRAVVDIASGGERIPTIRTARGVTTMLSLPEEAREAICGDLFDAQTGNGGFVIQRSGRDLFLKPLRAAGGTNLFVKTEHATYAFELAVVPPARAMRIVRVTGADPRSDPDRAERERIASDRATLDAERAAFDRERAEASASVERRRAELDREARARAASLAREWIVASVRRGTAVVPVTRREAKGEALDVELGDALLSAGGRAYLRCAIRNRSSQPVTVATAEISGASRTHSVLNLVVSPGETAVVVLEVGAEPARGDTLRLLDPAGTALVAFKPFR